MNLSELKAKVVKWSHRSDLDDEMDGFVNNVSERLGRRFGTMPPPLIAPTDTNDLLTYHSNLYLYGTLKEQAAYTHNADGMNVYEGLFQQEVSQMNINYHGSDWDTQDPPVIEPFIEEVA